MCRTSPSRVSLDGLTEAVLSWPSVRPEHFHKRVPRWKSSQLWYIARSSATRGGSVRNWLTSGVVMASTYRSGALPRCLPGSLPRCLPRCGLEPQADAVDAVTLVGRDVIALALEDVPQVRPAVGTTHLDPLRTRAEILDVLHPVPCQRSVEGGPAAVAVELGIAAEELGTAGATGVDTLSLGVRVLTDAGSLCACQPQDLVLGRGQLLVPLLIGLGQGIGTAVAHRCPSVSGCERVQG